MSVIIMDRRKCNAYIACLTGEKNNKKGCDNDDKGSCGVHSIKFRLAGPLFQI